MAIRPRTAGVSVAFILAMAVPAQAANAADSADTTKPVYKGGTVFTAYNTEFATAKSKDFTLSATDNSPVAFSVTQPTHGKVSVGSTTTTNGTQTAQLTFTPNTTTTFSDTVTVTISDGTNTTTQSVKLAMAQNAVPTGTAISGKSTGVGKALEIALNGKDTESPTSSLTYQKVEGSEQGGTVDITGSKATFTPAANFTGDASFKYTVTDPQSGVSQPITVNITVAKGADLTAPKVTAPDITVGKEVTLSTTVTPNPSSSTDALTGTVTFWAKGTDGNLTKIGAGTRGTGDNASKWELKTKTLPAGTYSVVATYTGDTVYADSTSTAADVIVNKAAAEVTLTAPTAVRAGQKFDLSAVVKATADGGPAPSNGKVTFSWKGSDGTSQPLGDAVSSTDGTYKLTGATVPAIGSATITASFTGDTNLGDKTGTQNVEVSKGTSSVSVSVPTTAQPAGTSVPLKATITPGVSAAAGDKVEFFDNGDPIPEAGTVAVDAKGVATAGIDYTPTAVGEHRITARYAGGANLNASTDSSPAVFKTSEAASKTAAVTVAESSSAAVGVSTTLSTTVTGDGNPTGTVQFYADGKAVGEKQEIGSDGKFSLPYTYTTAGSVSFTAKYSGDDNSSASTSEATKVTVKAADTTTVGNVTVSGDEVAGGELTLSTTLSPKEGLLATDKVKFYDGDPAETTGENAAVLLGTGTVDVAKGVATLKHTFTTVTTTDKPHNIYAVYAGNDNLPKGTSATGLSVDVDEATAEVTLSGSSEGVSSPVKLTANVDLKGASAANATVQFRNEDTGQDLGDPVAVTGGKAEYTAPAVTSAGTYNYSATLTSANADAPKATASVKIAAGKASQKLESSLDADGKVTLTDKITGPEGVPTDGTVSFFADGESLGSADVADGTAVLKNLDLTAGKHNIVAVYKSAGDLSDSTAAIVIDTTPVITVTKPVIAGVVTVGHQLSTHAKADHDATVHYQWMRDGKKVGTDKGTYMLTAADAGAKITVKAFASAEGFTAGDATSAATAAVAKGTITATVAPVLRGSGKVGYLLIPTTGTWNPAGTKTTFTWLRDGKVFKTGVESYRLVKADAKHRFAVKVTATATGYNTTTKTTNTVVAK